MDNPDELNKEYEKLCRMTGHLFIAFARLEGELAAMLKMHLANRMSIESLDENIALSSAIYGPMRFQTAKDAVKRIAAAEDVCLPTRDFAAALFAHVGHIQDLRDKIAHQQLAPAYVGSNAQWQLVDATTTRNIKEPKVYVFQTAAVSAAARDAILAANRLGIAPGTGHILSSLEHDLSPIGWQYKPSMLRLVPLSELRKP